jgi:hypothetical protein
MAAMSRMTTKHAAARWAGVPLAACVALALMCGSLRGQAPDGFVPLFDGTLSGWVVEDTDAGNFRVAGGVLRVEGPGGWLRSERRFLDFALRTEFRFLTPDADSGIFLRAAGDTQFIRGWPNNSYQVQLRNPLTPSPFPPVGGLFRHGMPPGETELDTALVEKLFEGTGAWHTLVVELVGERLTVRLNGTVVMRAENISAVPGYVGIQGETGAVEYRTIDIREQ